MTSPPYNLLSCYFLPLIFIFLSICFHTHPFIFGSSTQLKENTSYFTCPCGTPIIPNSLLRLYLLNILWNCIQPFFSTISGTWICCLLKCEPACVCVCASCIPLSELLYEWQTHRLVHYKCRSSHRLIWRHHIIQFRQISNWAMCAPVLIWRKHSVDYLKLSFRCDKSNLAQLQKCLSITLSSWYVMRQRCRGWSWRLNGCECILIMELMELWPEHSKRKLLHTSGDTGWIVDGYWWMATCVYASG